MGRSEKGRSEDRKSERGGVRKGVNTRRNTSCSLSVSDVKVGREMGRSEKGRVKIGRVRGEE